jgi:hypothetical protein
MPVAIKGVLAAVAPRAPTRSPAVQAPAIISKTPSPVIIIVMPPMLLLPPLVPGVPIPGMPGIACMFPMPGIPGMNCAVRTMPA